MKRRILALLASVSLITTLFTSCGKTANTTSAVTEEGSGQVTEALKEVDSETMNNKGSTDKPVELIFTSVSVTGDSHTTAMTAFADKVKELSGGTVTCKTYSDGSLFTADNEFDALLAGDADLAYISFPTLSTQPGLEWCSMLQSGYFWNSYEHMTKVLNGDIGKNKIRSAIEEKVNIVPLSSFYLGARVVNTRNKEINSYKDMKGLLLRMPNSEAWLNLGAALGANPTPLSFSELYTALQTGAVDAQDNPLPTDVSAKFYEVTKYIAITNHVIDSIMPCINKDTWNSLSENQKKAVTDAMEYARTVNDKARIDQEKENIKFLESKGITITYPDLKDFKANVQKYYKEHTDQTASWDMNLYNEIQAAAE